MKSIQLKKANYNFVKQKQCKNYKNKWPKLKKKLTIIMYKVQYKVIL